MKIKYILYLLIEKQNITKNVFLSVFFFLFLCTKTSKYIRSILYGEMERRLEKQVLFVFLSFLSKLPKYQNAKKDEQHSISRKRTTLPKIFILSVFHIMQQNIIMHADPYMKKQNDITGNVSFDCLLECQESKC